VVKENKNFIGRKKELKTIKTLNDQNEAQILICFGRRRVGKTELIEQAFRKTKLLKFEGLKGKSQKEEIQHFLNQLAKYLVDPNISLLQFTSWRQCFELVSEHTRSGNWTIYLEELQWMACYESDLVSELKYVWDNFLRRNPKLRLVLCGSATSFMLTEVVRSQVLYNRSQTIIELKEFSIQESKLFLKGHHSTSELMDTYLSIGGIPEYLKKLRGGPSIFLKMCEQSFTSDGFFKSEIERIFVSQFAERKNYKRIVDYLSQRKYATREQILVNLGIKSNGKVTALLEDLEICNFISAQGPIAKGLNTKLKRYQVADAYLRFYYKFILKQIKAIDRGQFEKSPIKGLNRNSWRKWLGFSFEHWCLNHASQISEILGFSDVNFRVGPSFSRATEKESPGFQIDLMFDRDDKVITVCEIKYTETLVGKEIIAEFEKKLALLNTSSNKSIQKILITAAGAKPEIHNYFDSIVTLEELVNIC
jgi:AAA+ ATPase superfamily predicted ATPase